MTATPDVIPGAAAIQAGGRRPGIGAVLGRPRFSLLVAGQTVSQLGDKLHHMALIALVGAGATAQTGGLELAKLSVVFTAPVLLLGPLAGALVDRWNRPVTMIACDVLRFGIVLALPAVYSATGHLWTVYVATFFVFLLGLFFNNAKMALIPDLVPEGELLSANAALSFIGRFATVAGILGGGVIIGLPVWRRLGWSDWAAGFYLDSFSFLVSAIALAGLLGVAGERRRSRGSAEIAGLTGTLRAWRDVAAAWRLVSRDGVLRFVFFTVALLGAFAAAVYVAMTLSVQTVLGKGAAGVGYLGGALAAGMVVGSLLVGPLASRVRKEHLILACTTTIGALMMLGGLRFSFAMFAPVAAVGGAMLAPVLVAQDTLLHEHAPADARAVIFSTRDVVLGAAFVAAAFVVGGSIWLFGRLGIAAPYRVVLIAFGAVISLAASVGGLAALRAASRRPPGMVVAGARG